MVRHYRRQRGGESVRLTTARNAFNDNMDDMTKRNEYFEALYDEINSTDDDTTSIKKEYIEALYVAIDNTDDAATISSLEAKLTQVEAPTKRPTPLTEGGGRRRRRPRRSRRPRKSRRSRRSRKSRRSRRH